jgi:hypothetical protein
VLDARASADGVRAEGMELVSNLREMGDVLRSNAERLLRDVQSIHARMVGELDRVEPEPDSTSPSAAGEAAGGEAAGVEAAGESDAGESDAGEAAAGEFAAGERDAGQPAAEDTDVLDVPDFVARQ